MVVHKKVIKKQNKKAKKNYFSYESSSLQKIIPMIASNGSHKTDMKKNLTNVKNKFLKKSLSRKTLLMTVSMVVHRKDIKKQNVKN